MQMHCVFSSKGQKVIWVLQYADFWKIIFSDFCLRKSDFAEKNDCSCWKIFNWISICIFFVKMRRLSVWPLKLHRFFWRYRLRFTKTVPRDCRLAKTAPQAANGNLRHNEASWRDEKDVSVWRKRRLEREKHFSSSRRRQNRNSA